MPPPVRLPALAAVLLAAACGSPIFGPEAATTTLTPPPGAFNGTVEVTLEADRAAELFVTTDGTDPHVESMSRLVGPSPMKIELRRTTTLTFFSRTAQGAEEEMRAVQYVRAGGPLGTATGVIVVGHVAVGKPIALFVNGRNRMQFEPLDAPGEIPFVVDGLTSGSLQLVARADRDGDGNFLPVLDEASNTFGAHLDMADPFHASVEGVRLYLGASPEGLCTITGTIQVPRAALGQSVSIAALGGNAFDGNLDPMSLLAQLQNGYQVFAREGSDAYPYAITDLEPGQYIPVPLLTSFGQGGIGLNFLANPLAPVTCRAGDVRKVDFAFGPVGLSGSVRVTPDAPAQGFTYGIVAGKNASLTGGFQVMLMPTLLRDEAGVLVGGYAGQGARASTTFRLKAFTSVSDQSALPAALGWAINPLEGGEHARVSTSSADVVQDIVLPVPSPTPSPSPSPTPSPTPTPTPDPEP